MSGFPKWMGGKRKHIELTDRRIGEKQGYLQKMMQKSKTREQN